MLSSTPVTPFMMSLDTHIDRFQSLLLGMYMRVSPASRIHLENTWYALTALQHHEAIPSLPAATDPAANRQEQLVQLLTGGLSIVMAIEYQEAGHELFMDAQTASIEMIVNRGAEILTKQRPFHTSHLKPTLFTASRYHYALPELQTLLDRADSREEKAAQPPEQKPVDDNKKIAELTYASFAVIYTVFRHLSEPARRALLFTIDEIKQLKQDIQTKSKNPDANLETEFKRFAHCVTGAFVYVLMVEDSRQHQPVYPYATVDAEPMTDAAITQKIISLGEAVLQQQLPFHLSLLKTAQLYRLGDEKHLATIQAFLDDFPIVKPVPPAVITTPPPVSLPEPPAPKAIIPVAEPVVRKATPATASLFQFFKQNPRVSMAAAVAITAVCVKLMSN